MGEREGGHGWSDDIVAGMVVQPAKGGRRQQAGERSAMFGVVELFWSFGQALALGQKECACADD